jgi:hypothetical protein
MPASYLKKYQETYEQPCPFEELVGRDLPAWNILRAAWSESPLTDQVCNSETYWMSSEEKRSLLRTVMSVTTNEDVAAARKEAMNRESRKGKGSGKKDGRPRSKSNPNRG